MMNVAEGGLQYGLIYVSWWPVEQLRLNHSVQLIKNVTHAKGNRNIPAYTFCKQE